MLESEGFIVARPDMEGFEMTPIGRIASGIAEIHPLVMAKGILHWGESFSAIQLVSLLSCFADVKVPEDKRIYQPRAKDPWVLSKITELTAAYAHYHQLELDREIYTGIQYENALVFDLVDEMPEWCRCETEEQSKYFLQTRITGEKGMSVGDFTKACLKISTISKEWMAVCEPFGLIGLMNQLGSVDNLILKYIATTQSLYV